VQHASRARAHFICAVRLAPGRIRPAVTEGNPTQLTFYFRTASIKTPRSGCQ
jgi:hypothetical protein